jgi:hypothetical protein
VPTHVDPGGAVTWQRTVAVSAGRAVARRAGSSVRATPDRVAGRFRVDQNWRRLDDGYAARLGPRETIDVARPVGRWRKVDPRRPEVGWQAIGKAAGLTLWAGVVGVAWWVGSSRGRGPLSGVAEVDRFGEAIGFAGDDDFA